MSLGSNIHLAQHVKGKYQPGNEKQCNSAQKAQLLGEERFASKRECLGNMKAESRRATQYPNKYYCGLQFRVTGSLVFPWNSIQYSIIPCQVTSGGFVIFFISYVNISNECYIIQFCPSLSQTSEKQESYLGQSNLSDPQQKVPEELSILAQMLI